MHLYFFIKRVANVLFRLIFRIEVFGKDNITKEGRVILCSNHINNLDPFLLSIIFPRQIFWMAKRQLFKFKLIAYLLNKLGVFPVDRDEADLSAIKNSLKVLKKENVLGIFPEGTRVKEINLENAKPGIALISIKAQAPILPVYIDGNYRLFSKIRVYIGESIDFSNSYGKKLTTEDYKSYSKDILKAIYSIKYKEGEV
ncbi:lysophospholipid acyltransferase family protein [Tissierella sp.]|uniref:lysophospholipid acyltransferase family protein n=1 Tax=Tissierella sp. TaxID=41274 RepID=UPI00285A8292|nr:lysophospholipid acyltransferase family protein [Tissierella sp.]MDR7856186.1 lysophospholipid acyltransferase family protein [Tissierella sp.]